MLKRQETADCRADRRQLMQRAQDGDREAFQALVADVGPSVMRYLRRRIPDPNEVEDVLQETFMAIYESRHTYECGRAFEPWLFAIARYVAARHAKVFFARVKLEALEATIPDHGGRGSESVLAAVRRGLARMPLAQRQAFVLLRVQGLSPIEASLLTGASAGNLKVRAHRAYQYLKQILL